jgi:Mrp family chromosome partitioning ATPase
MADTISKRRRGNRQSRAPRTATGDTLVARSHSGDLLHVALPKVSSALRATVAKLRLGGELPYRIGVVSALRGEGATFISRALALVLANDTREKVCLVELNWRHPAKWSPGFDARAGIADVLRGTASLDEALAVTSDSSLTILPAGHAAIEEPPVFASSAELEQVLDELERRFDQVVIDLPAINATSEALTLAAYADAVALVVRQGVTSDTQVRLALEQLEGVPVLGVVLNAFETKVPPMIARRFPAT